ncbi:hypothetical protein THF1C08_710002 [Vibrio jasicida]|uniref:Secreted protein n=1 Tax=Vibrio jasicida TaxID=766224 RepID=A0AAU9QF46_9VIBR|nr:hypothetical protein THF1A12_1020002 [Vibrio jasicida]CAH1601948.1 hypothetical protein THF1C08_710002 [Vibrio jasicida]
MVEEQHGSAPTFMRWNHFIPLMVAICGTSVVGRPPSFTGRELSLVRNTAPSAYTMAAPQAVSARASLPTRPASQDILSVLRSAFKF